ncbi:MAG: amino acid ABC transporter substrate-binding protein [Burkholderiales bacterium]
MIIHPSKTRDDLAMPMQMNPSPFDRVLSHRACVAALLSVLAFVTPVHAGPVLDRIKHSGRIVLAHRESSVPFSYVGADGKPVGYAIDLCMKLAEAVRKKLELKAIATEFLPVTPASRIAAVVDGKADLECGSTTNNAERRQKVAFTIPHYITGTRYMVRADSPIEDLAMFENRKLVSTKGGTPLKAIESANRDRMLRINILEAPDNAKAVEMVESGAADGFAMDDVQLYGLISGRADPGKLKVVGKFLTIEALAIMMSKDDPELKQVVDEEMRRLIYSREAHALYARWFGKPIPPKNRALDVPMNYLLKDFWQFPTDWVPN